MPYAKMRFVNETRCLYGVMEKHLGAAPNLAGETYAIADIAAHTGDAKGITIL
jgi:glutathione S-transferase